MQDEALAVKSDISSSPQGTQPLDKIFVRDLVLDCEIGVFHNEKGVTQRVRFNVDVDVLPNTAYVEDDFDQVISYDMIMEGIKDILSEGHINLVETLAERIADHCLTDPRAAKVVVRVEKLDKEPDAVGVEIVRIPSENTRPNNKSSG